MQIHPKLRTPQTPWWHLCGRGRILTFAMITVLCSLLSLCIGSWSYNNENTSSSSVRSSVHKKTTTSTTTTKSVLVIVMGSLRAGEVAWQSLYDNLLVPNNADLALMIGDTIPQQYQNASLLSRAKYVWQFPEYEDWAEALDMIPNPQETWPGQVLSYFNNRSGLLGGVLGVKGSGAIIFMIRWFLAQEIQKLQLHTKYDTVVLTRSDHYYLCKQDLSTFDVGNYAWIPELEGYHGVTDRHLVVGGDNLLDAIDILPTLFQHYKKFLPNDHPELVLAKVWKLHGLQARTTRRVMFTTARDDDITRWREPGDLLPGLGGLHSKYFKEYKRSLVVCRQKDEDGYAPVPSFWFYDSWIWKKVMPKFVIHYFMLGYNWQQL